MKFYRILFLLCGMIYAIGAQADRRDDDDIPNYRSYAADMQFYYGLDVDQDEILGIERHPAIKKQLWRELGYRSSDSAGLLNDAYDPAAHYETVLPRNSQPVISPFEKVVLTAYLDNPNDAVLAKILALYHLRKSLVRHGNPDGEGLKHTVIAQYFLYRAQKLGANHKWIKTSLRKTDDKLSQLFKRPRGVKWEETHAAHAAFYDAFNYHEENRYIASAALMDDMVRQPNNVFTAFLINGLNLWVGGEADYDDPTALYNFVVGGYFSTLTIKMARELQEAWFADPAHNTRFRLVPILGGFTALHKRWLAKLHGDAAAVALIDQEHREWRLINEPFHAFTVGMALYEEEENFEESHAAFLRAFSGCDERPDIRTCPDSPRFSFNIVSILLGWVDYFLKTGDYGSAQFFLSLKNIPPFHFSEWDLGRAAWEQRENNLAAFFDLYQNGDPSDDPKHFFLKGRKWSTSTSTCQMCHQAQSREWTEEEKNTITLPPEDMRTITTWPESGTTWYAAVK